MPQAGEIDIGARQNGRDTAFIHVRFVLRVVSEPALYSCNGQCTRRLGNSSQVFVGILHRGTNFIVIHGNDFVQQLGTDGETDVTHLFYRNAFGEMTDFW